MKKISSLDEITKKPFSKVTIEFNENYNIDEVKKILSKYGDTSVNFVIRNKNKKVCYSLQNSRKLDFKDFKVLKSKEYVAKITF